MRRKKLLKYLRGNGDYTFKIKNYLIPKQILTVKDHCINLEQNRENNLKQGSTWSPKFQEFLDTKHKNIDYIREFPLAIKNQNLWLSLCKVHQVPKELQSRNYFLADYFIHEYNFIVEIDSQYHNVEYDKARDDYVKLEYGLDVLRFYEYGKDVGQKFLNDFEFTINYCKRSNVVPVKISYSDLIVTSYLSINSKLAKVIVNAEHILAENKNKKILILTPDNLSQSDYSQLLKEKNLNEITNYFRFTYGTRVILVT